MVIALQGDGADSEQVYNPGPETRLAEGDVMIVLGKADQIERLREYVHEGGGPS